MTTETTLIALPAVRKFHTLGLIRPDATKQLINKFSRDTVGFLIKDYTLELYYSDRDGVYHLRNTVLGSGERQRYSRKSDKAIVID